MCMNCIDGICQNQCVPLQEIEVCDRCRTPVTFSDVSEGYYAVCPKHDEDLMRIEVETRMI